MITTATLKSGIVVGNFSSPHEFKFDDGTILDRCADEQVWLGQLSYKEIVYSEKIRGIEISQIQLIFSLNYDVLLALAEAKKLCDILIVPLPVMQAIKEQSIAIENCRVIRIVDRLNKIASASKFCI